MKSVTMATKREMSDYTVFFSVLGHKKFIHKILAKSESVRFQPLFKIFWCSQRIALKVLNIQMFFILFTQWIILSKLNLMIEAMPRSNLLQQFIRNYR